VYKYQLDKNLRLLKWEDTALALLPNLSDNYAKTISKQCPSSLVVKHGPGGRFEPTT